MFECLLSSELWPYYLPFSVFFKIELDPKVWYILKHDRSVLLRHFIFFVFTLLLEWMSNSNNNGSLDSLWTGRNHLTNHSLASVYPSKTVNQCVHVRLDLQLNSDTVLDVKCLCTNPVVLMSVKSTRFL